MAVQWLSIEDYTYPIETNSENEKVETKEDSSGGGIEWQSIEDNSQLFIWAYIKFLISHQDELYSYEDQVFKLPNQEMTKDLFEEYGIETLTQEDLNFIEEYFNSEGLEIKAFVDGDSTPDVLFRIKKEPKQVIFMDSSFETGSTLSGILPIGVARVLVSFDDGLNYLNPETSVIDIEEQIFEFEYIDVTELKFEKLDDEALPRRNYEKIDSIYEDACDISYLNNIEFIKLAQLYPSLRVLYILDENDFLEKIEIHNASEVKTSPTVREYKIKNNTIKEVE